MERHKIQHSLDGEGCSIQLLEKLAVVGMTLAIVYPVFKLLSFLSRSFLFTSLCVLVPMISIMWVLTPDLLEYYINLLCNLLRASRSTPPAKSFQTAPRVTQDITDGSLPTKRAQPDPRNRATSPISTATTVAMRFGTIGDMIDEAIEHEVLSDSAPTSRDENLPKTIQSRVRNRDGLLKHIENQKSLQRRLNDYRQRVRSRHSLDQLWAPATLDTPSGTQVKDKIPPRHSLPGPKIATPSPSRHLELAEQSFSSSQKSLKEAREKASALLSRIRTGSASPTPTVPHHKFSYIRDWRASVEQPEDSIGNITWDDDISDETGSLIGSRKERHLLAAPSFSSPVLHPHEPVIERSGMHPLAASAPRGDGNQATRSPGASEDNGHSESFSSPPQRLQTTLAKLKSKIPVKVSRSGWLT